MGGGTGTGFGVGPEGLIPYATWNLSMGKYFVGDVEKGLAKALKGVGLNNGLFGGNKFRGKGIEVCLETYSGVMSRIKIDLYTDGDGRPEDIQKAIQSEVDSQRTTL